MWWFPQSSFSSPQNSISAFCLFCTTKLKLTLWLVMNWCLISLPMLIVLQKETIWFYNCSSSYIRHSEHKTKQQKKKLTLSLSETSITTPISFQLLGVVKKHPAPVCFLMHVQAEWSHHLYGWPHGDGSLQAWFFIQFGATQDHKHYRLPQTKLQRKLLLSHLIIASCLTASRVVWVWFEDCILSQTSGARWLFKPLWTP